MENTIFAIILGVIIPGIMLTVLCCFLQAWLSKQETRWFGLVLPVLHGVFTVLVLVAMVGMVSFSTMTLGGESVSVTNYQENQEQYVVDEIETEVSFAQVLNLIVAFFIVNIPTLLYFLIYRYTKRNLSKFEELTRMAVLDLE